MKCGLRKMTRAELKQLCKSVNIKDVSTANKDVIVETLVA